MLNRTLLIRSLRLDCPRHAPFRGGDDPAEGGKSGTTELVQSETSDFGFEVQDWSNFRFFRAVDESSILMPCTRRGARCDKSKAEVR